MNSVTISFPFLDARNCPVDTNALVLVATPIDLSKKQNHRAWQRGPSPAHKWEGKSRAAAKLLGRRTPLGRVGHAREERGGRSPRVPGRAPPVPGRAHGMESLLRNHTNKPRGLKWQERR